MSSNLQNIKNWVQKSMTVQNLTDRSKKSRLNFYRFKIFSSRFWHPFYKSLVWEPLGYMIKQFQKYFLGTSMKQNKNYLSMQSIIPLQISSPNMHCWVLFPGHCIKPFFVQFKITSNWSGLSHTSFDWLIPFSHLKISLLLIYFLSAWLHKCKAEIQVSSNGHFQYLSM